METPRIGRLYVRWMKLHKNMNKGKVFMFWDAGVLKKMNIKKVFIFLSVCRTKQMAIDQLSMSTRKGAASI